MTFRKFRFTFLCIGLLAAFSRAEAYQQFTCAGSLIRMVDSAEAAFLNAQPDAYTRALTNFDLSARLNRASGLKMQDYLKKAAESVHNWNADEEKMIRKSFNKIDSVSKALGISLHLPDTVIVINTDAGEEFHAEGYTRLNRIMLNPASGMVGTAVVAHELWHVISRHNKELRDRAYAVFHFQPCNTVDYKTPFKNKVITNPDCPEVQNFVRVQIDGKETDMALMIRAASDFKPGISLNEYAQPVLIVLDGDDMHKQVLIKNGKAVYYQLDQVPDFFSKVGQNTPYLLHVEEITAEHFAALITNRNVKQKEYVTALQSVLKP
jgi:hypothetical protein